MSFTDTVKDVFINPRRAGVQTGPIPGYSRIWKERAQLDDLILKDDPAWELLTVESFNSATRRRSVLRIRLQADAAAEKVRALAERLAGAIERRTNAHAGVCEVLNPRGSAVVATAIASRDGGAWLGDTGHLDLIARLTPAATAPKARGPAAVVARSPK